MYFQRVVRIPSVLGIGDLVQSRLAAVPAKRLANEFRLSVPVLLSARFGGER